MTELVGKFIGDVGYQAGRKLCGPKCADIGRLLATTGSRLVREKLKKKKINIRVGHVLPGKVTKNINKHRRGKGKQRARKRIVYT